MNTSIWDLWFDNGNEINKHYLPLHLDRILKSYFLQITMPKISSKVNCAIFHFHFGKFYTWISGIFISKWRKCLIWDTEKASVCAEYERLLEKGCLNTDNQWSPPCFMCEKRVWFGTGKRKCCVWKPAAKARDWAKAWILATSGFQLQSLVGNVYS